MHSFDQRSLLVQIIREETGHDVVLPMRDNTKMYFLWWCVRIGPYVTHRLDCSFRLPPTTPLRTYTEKGLGARGKKTAFTTLTRSWFPCGETVSTHGE